MSKEAISDKNFKLPLWLSYGSILYLIGITVFLGIIPNFLSIFQMEIYLPRLLKNHRLLSYIMINIFFSFCFYGMITPFQYKNQIEKKEIRFLSFMNFIPIFIGTIFLFTKLMINPPMKLVNLNIVEILFLMIIFIIIFLIFPVIHLLLLPILAYLY